jgi:hypothetical protein
MRSPISRVASLASSSSRAIGNLAEGMGHSIAGLTPIIHEARAEIKAKRSGTGGVGHGAVFDLIWRCTYIVNVLALLIAIIVQPWKTPYVPSWPLLVRLN